MDFQRSLPTLPLMPVASRPRRVNGSGSSETTLGSSDLYHREMFREGAPGPLCYYPAQTWDILPSNPVAAVWNTLLRPKVLSAMSTYDVNPRSIDLCRQRDEFWPRSDADETILIDAPTSHHVNDNWFLAISEIRQHFANVKWPNLIVEIADLKELRKYTWPIEPQERIVKKWPLIREVLLSQLGGEEASLLESINVFRRGMFEERLKCPITIVLTAPEVYGLRKIQDRIQDELDANGYCYARLEIVRDRICRDRIRRDGTCPGVNIRSMLEEYQKEVGMGASIGPKNTDSSGTLGGYVKLAYPDGQEMRFGLTCYHVVRPALTGPQIATSDKNGIPPSSTLGQSVTITHPSRKDHQEYIAKLKECILCGKSDLTRKRAELDEIERQIEMGVTPKGYGTARRGVIERETSNVVELQTLLEEKERFFSQTAEAGHVYAASGFRRSLGNHRLDWALIESPGHRQNLKIPARDQWGNIIGFSDRLSDWSRLMIPSRRVWKKGRATDITQGVVNAIRSDIFLDDMNTGEVVGSLEWVVIQEDEPQNFFSKGDTGSAVVDTYGGLVGLIMGETLAGGFTYMTPYTELIEDIEEVTGAEVSVH